jgi:hypothetical protein
MPVNAPYIASVNIKSSAAYAAVTVTAVRRINGLSQVRLANMSIARRIAAPPARDVARIPTVHRAAAQRITATPRLTISGSLPLESWSHTASSIGSVRHIAPAKGLL